MELTTLPLLAPVSDLQDRRGLPVDDDPQTLQFLADASTFFRSYTSQQITYVEDDAIELQGTWDDTLRLPQLPVIDVTVLQVTYPGEIEPVDMFEEIWTATRRGSLYKAGGWGGDNAVVNVTYSHGFDVVPDDVRRCVSSMAHRMLSNPNDAIGEQIGSYSIQYAQRSSQDAGLQVGLSVREQYVLDKYRYWAA